MSDKNINLIPGCPRFYHLAPYMVFDTFFSPLSTMYMLDQILNNVVLENANHGSNNFLYVFIAVLVEFNDTVYISYKGIHLKYCQDTDT